MAFWKKAEETQREAPPAETSASKAGANGLSVHGSGASGAAKNITNPAAPELSADQLRKMAGAAKGATAAFGQMATLLMRSPQYQHYTLADLEWLVVPALMTDQFSVVTAQSKTKGLTSPVGLVLWARVSEEVDKRLSANPGEPVRLKPQEWKSGDIIWVLMAIGDGRIVQGLLKQLQDKKWGGKRAKIIARAKDGKPMVGTLEGKAA